MLELIEHEESEGIYKNPGIKEKFNFQISNQLIDKLYVKPFQKCYPRGLWMTQNVIDNTKFSWYSFIPIFLYMEFSDFSNLYYLLLTATQFIPALSVGFKISYFFPLVTILSFRAFEEIY